MTRAYLSTERSGDRQVLLAMADFKPGWPVTAPTVQDYLHGFGASAFAIQEWTRTCGRMQATCWTALAALALDDQPAFVNGLRDGLAASFGR